MVIMGLLISAASLSKVEHCVVAVAFGAVTAVIEYVGGMPFNDVSVLTAMEYGYALSLTASAIVGGFQSQVAAQPQVK